MAVYKRNKYQSYKKASPMLQLAKMGIHYARKYKQRQQSKKQTSNYVTTQKDSSLQYRKKRMPYRKRKQWTKFVRKVHHVNLNSLGTYTAVYNRIYTVTNATQAQGVGWAVLYGKNGEEAPTNGAGYSDMFKIIDGNTDVGTSSKLHFRSAVMDLTMTNKSTVPIELDVYHIVFWDECDFISPQLLLENAQAGTVTAPPVGTNGTLRLDNRGTTLFDLPLFISMGKVKILKKYKYFVPAEDSVTYQVRDARNRTISQRSILPVAGTRTSFVQPGWTQCIVTVHKPTAGNQATAAALHVGVTRKYAYCIESNSEAKDAIVTY